MRSGCCDDIRAAARLLHPEATKKERANGGGKAPERFLRFLQSAGRSGHSAPLAGAGGVPFFFPYLGARGLTPQDTVLSSTRPILVFPRHLTAVRPALDRHKRSCAVNREGCPSVS